MSQAGIIGIMHARAIKGELEKVITKELKNMKRFGKDLILRKNSKSSGKSMH